MAVEVDVVRSVEVPTRMVHGPGALARLGELQRELGIERPLLVTDKGVAAAGLVDRALEQLDGAVLFDGVRPNPDIELVGEGSAAYRESGCDGLVALGGGSSIDAAKAIGVEVVHGGSILEYEYGGTPLTKRVPPLVAIPTTAGTGSEVTLWAVITDHERQIKFNVGGTPLIGPHAALIDPELMLGLPPAVTAATGLDALSHGDRVLHLRLPPAVQRRRRSACDRARRRLGCGPRSRTAPTLRRARTWRTPRRSAGWRTGRRVPAPRMR